MSALSAKIRCAETVSTADMEISWSYALNIESTMKMKSTTMLHLTIQT